MGSYPSHKEFEKVNSYTTSERLYLWNLLSRTLPLELCRNLLDLPKIQPPELGTGPQAWSAMEALGGISSTSKWRGKHHPWGSLKSSEWNCCVLEEAFVTWQRQQHNQKAAYDSKNILSEFATMSLQCCGCMPLSAYLSCSYQLINQCPTWFISLVQGGKAHIFQSANSRAESCSITKLFKR